MTEQELRNKVVSIMLDWEGAQRGDNRHAEILRIYNNHQPLARGYAVQKNDAYCATTASAAYIKAGIAAYTGTECGVGQWIDIAVKKGIWVENDAHTPKPGDAICYDWSDSGVGEDMAYPDHVGIVVSVNGSSFVVIEGNINNGKVGRRSMQVNGRYIRGFICPDFAAIAAELSGEDAPGKSVEELAQEVNDGVWGVDPERRERLKAAGYDPDKVQAAVNAMYKPAEAVPVADDVEATPEPTNERDRLLALMGDQWVERFSDLPDWAKDEVRELIELGALAGTQQAETVEDTVIRGTINGLIRPAIVSLRLCKVTLLVQNL